MKILGIGAAILDVLSRVDDSFLKTAGGAKGGMEMISAEQAETLFKRLPGYTREIGGSTVNTMLGLVNLGVPASLLAKVAEDAEGVFFRNRYRELGGSDVSFKIAPGERTGRCFCMITPDSERTMRTCIGASGTISAADLSDRDFEDVTHVHMEGYQLFYGDFAEQALAFAKKHGCTVSFDLASFEIVRLFRDRIREILKRYVDIVFANETESAEFLGTEPFSPEKAASEFRKYCTVAAVKLGRKGAFLASGTGTARVDAVLVDAVDTTGAGDLWQSGFLYGYLTGKDLMTCGKMGAIMGAEVVSVIGGSIPEDGWKRIRKQFRQLEQNGETR